MKTQSVTCEILSHSHAPPLRPAANLSFDLRRVSNPPKHIRDQYDGRSKRLREHLIHEPVFSQLLDDAVKQILQAATEMVSQSHISSATIRDPATSGFSACHDSEQPDENILAESSSGRTYGPTVFDDSRHYNNSLEPVVNSQSKEDPLPESGESVEVDEQEPTKSDPVLRISCFCERGRHRSVAFAEELARRLDERATGAMVVKLQHRDVEVKPKKNSGRMRGFGRRSSRVLGATLIADDGESQDLE